MKRWTFSDLPLFPCPRMTARRRWLLAYREARKALRLHCALQSYLAAKGKPHNRPDTLLSIVMAVDPKAWESACSGGDWLRFPPRRWPARGGVYRSRVTGRTP